jgi:hypothetical protein
VSKYRNIPTVIDGLRFASKAEARRYQELCLLQRAVAVYTANSVRWFIRQPSFDLPGGIRYIADFLVIWDDGRITVEDVKGVETQVFKIKKKLFEEKYGPLTIIKGGRK